MATGRLKHTEVGAGLDIRVDAVQSAVTAMLTAGASSPSPQRRRGHGTRREPMLMASTVAATVILEPVSGGTARGYDTHPASPVGGGEDAAAMSVGRDRRTCSRVA